MAWLMLYVAVEYSNNEGGGATMKLHSIKSVLLAVAIAVGAVVASPVSATTYDLGDLIADPTTGFIVGDKLFFNFTCSKTGPGGSLCDEINVNSLDNLDYGIEFQGAFSASAGQNDDWLIVFNVLVLTPGVSITDIQLLFNGAFTGTGLTNTVETVTGIPGNVFAGQIQVTNPPPVFSAHVDLLAPYSQIHVAKDIQAIGGTDGTAFISFVDQRFSQSAPEPTTLLLFGAGLAGLGVFRRRKAA